MKKQLFAIYFLSSFIGVSTMVFCQGVDNQWFVWKRTSPCRDSRQDWYAVAKTFPGFGFEIGPTDGPISTFLSAMSIADSRKLGPDFRNYCCLFDVYRNISTGAFSVIKQSSFQTPGTGLVLFRTGLCCEAAFALAGFPPGNDCRNLRLSTGAIVSIQPNGTFNTIVPPSRDPNMPNIANTACFPGSFATFNPQTNRIECFCNAGLVWNERRDACVEPREVAVNTNCSSYPGTSAAWNSQTQRMECFCNQGLVWNSNRTACIDKNELVRNADCSAYPGSYAAWNEQNQRVECWCPQGKMWNSTNTACIDQTPAVNCWPGSYAAFNPQTNRTECFCNQGLVWNSTNTACIQPVQDPNDRHIAEIIVTQQNVMISVWDHACEDGDIITLLINGRVYLSNHRLTNTKKEFNVTLNTGNNFLEIVAVDSGTECPANPDKTNTRNSAAIHITNAIQGGDQSWELSMGARTGANFVVRQ
jgi:hypothetical protein